jgi:type IV pilus assembly protein PilM
MAVGSESVWAVDLGNASLKALHLMAVGDAVQVIGFDHIPHGKILSGGGINAAEREELIAISLRQFVQRNDVSEDTLIVSVPSQNSFVRFVTLPPVEQKRLPEIIRFEAAQQIPFDMAEVQWDHQLMNEPDSKERKVGIFAIKNEIVKAAMEHFEREDLQVGYVQIAPMALYNFLLYDRPELARSDTQATVIVNVGADCTDLVVCTKSGVWQRCIMTGGNAFTQAIAETFKLSFEKAEKLKRTAPVSKYARQIFQAMRPVFTDWAAEVQRSLGFYTSSNTDVKLTRVIAMGGGTKLRGLVKYLTQTLEIPVEKPETFKRLAIAEGLSAAKFHDNVADFGVVYGLGLQGVGMARIESNLLPGSVVRSMAWANKTRYFIAAAVMVLVFSLMCLARVGADWMGYAQKGPVLAMNKAAKASAQDVLNDTTGRQTESEAFQDKEKKQVEAFKYREVVPELYRTLYAALPNASNNPDQKALYEAYAQGDVTRIKQMPRNQRKQLFLVNVTISYSTDLANAQFGETAVSRKDALALQAQQMEQQAQEASRGGGRRDLYGEQAAQTVVGDLGFVVTVVGYSPMGKDVRSVLLDPPGVEKDPKRWGFITRLANLDKNRDVNSPFELYKRPTVEIKAFPVDYQNAPWGVGIDGASLSRVMAAGTPTANVLLDPLTLEPISAEMAATMGNLAIDPSAAKYVRERDYWFTVSFKMKWKNAPQPAGATSAAATPAP